MAKPTAVLESEKRPSWWRSIGPALITACVVFGPGSLLVSSNVGASYGYELLWLLLLLGLLMGTYYLACQMESSWDYPKRPKERLSTR